jgi:hypothetical protein
MEVTQSLLESDIGDRLQEQCTLLDCSYQVVTLATSLAQLDPELTTVTFLRRKSRRFDSELNCYVPVNPPVISSENCTLFYFPAHHFCSLLSPDNSHDTPSISLSSLDALVHAITSHFNNHRILFLIQHLEKYYRKDAAKKGRAFRERVQQLSQAPAQEESDHSADSRTKTKRSRKKKKQDDRLLTRNEVEQALLHLQFEHNVFVTLTNNVDESVLAVRGFLREISHREYM